MIPTRGASTSISSNAASTSGIGSSSALGTSTLGLGARLAAASPLCVSPCLSVGDARRRPGRRCRCASACPRTRSARPPRRRARGPRPASGPSPVTFRTRPPAVTSSPASSRAVPAWVTSTPSGTAVEAADHVALRRALPGSRPRRGPRSPPSRRANSASTPGEPARLARGEAELEQVGRSRGSTAWVSGSPKRQLNSSTFGPASVEHQAGVEDAVEGRAAPAHQLDDRPVDDVGDLLDARRRRIPGTGE